MVATHSAGTYALPRCPQRLSEPAEWHWDVLRGATHSSCALARSLRAFSHTQKESHTTITLHNDDKEAHDQGETGDLWPRAASSPATATRQTCRRPDGHQQAPAAAKALAAMKTQNPRTHSRKNQTSLSFLISFVRLRPH